MLPTRPYIFETVLRTWPAIGWRGAWRILRALVTIGFCILMVYLVMLF
ncbi:MAG TPA: hypothetical protein VFE27_24180 [Acidobacteriaceae bacterium]|jgi:hypothetical protein|nr:hypothetical protein [Acidobacteriaceae bacterium]